MTANERAREHLAKQITDLRRSADYNNAAVTNRKNAQVHAQQAIENDTKAGEIRDTVMGLERLLVQLDHAIRDEARR